MKVYLIVASGKRKGFPILLQQNLFMMGSEDICQLRSPLPGVAPRHCAVRIDERKVFVRDLGSDEGTIVNGSRMPPARNGSCTRATASPWGRSSSWCSSPN